LEEQLRKNEDETKKLHVQLNEKSHLTTQLTTEKTVIKNERDELLKNIRRVEQESENNIAKVKQKHKEELEQLSNSFLQSLGADPNKDFRTVIKDMKDNNVDLTQQVDLLAETLARKERSLIEALKAVDDLLQYEEQTITRSSDNDDNKLNFDSRNSVANNGNSNKQNIQRMKPPLPKPVTRRPSQSRDSTQLHGPNAMFFKSAMSVRNTSQPNKNTK